MGEQDDNDRKIIENIYDTTPQFSHKIVVAIDFGTTYRYYLTFGVESFYLAISKKNLTFQIEIASPRHLLFHPKGSNRNL